MSVPPVALAPMPRRFVSLTCLVAGTALVAWSLLRLVLLLFTGPEAVGLGGALQAFLRGAWFDLAVLGILAAPFLALRALLPARWLTGRVGTALRLGLFWAFAVVLLFVAVAEFFFWEEFTTRFNFIAVDYLIYTQEVVGNIRQSYPMGLIFGGLAAAATLLTVLAARGFDLARPVRGGAARLRALLLAVLLPLASLGLARVEQMEGAGNTIAAELAGNGMFTFFAALRRNELDYDKFYRTIPQDRADAVLARLGVERAALSAGPDGKAAAGPHGPESLGPFHRRPKNVVLISVESLSAEYLGIFGDKRGLTPHLDRLAGAGLSFTQCYATGTRTVRGLEALSLGTPPVPGQAIVRRPRNEHLTTIGELLEHQGFATYFLYGGYGYFDNMNAYFKGNDYKVVDRTDFPKASIPFENAWGVADECLYDNSLPVMDAAHTAGKPFYLHLMTTSNHRPFTYTDGRIDIPSPGGREGAVKYTDWAIGKFIENAAAKPWFKDTLFVIVADHCASAAGRTRLPLDRYRIPMIFYGPELLTPGTYDRMASQIDLMPTLLDLLGARGHDQYYGESLFLAAGRPARAFVSNYQELGYYKGGILTVLRPQRGAEAQRIDPATLAGTPTALDPVLLEEAIAYYQTASRAFKQGALLSPDHKAAAAPR